jgi:hypothetical protein
VERRLSSVRLDLDSVLVAKVDDLFRRVDDVGVYLDPGDRYEYSSREQFFLNALVDSRLDFRSLEKFLDFIQGEVADADAPEKRKVHSDQGSVAQGLGGQTYLANPWALKSS